MIPERPERVGEVGAGQMGWAEIEMRQPGRAERPAVPRVAPERRRIVRDRSLGLAKFEERLTALQVGVRIFRIDADRLTEIAQRTVEIALQNGLLAARDERRDPGVDRCRDGRPAGLRWC